MFKKFFKSMLVAGALVVSVSAVSAATPNEMLAEYVKGNHKINGVDYKISEAQKVQVDRYLDTHELTETQVNTAIAKADEAKEVIADAGVTDLKDLPASVKSNVVTLVQDAGSAVGVTVSVDKNNKNFVVKDETGSVIGSASYKGDKLAFTGSNAMSLFVTVASMLGLSAIVYKMKKDFDAENN